MRHPFTIRQHGRRDDGGVLVACDSRVGALDRASGEALERGHAVDVRDERTGRLIATAYPGGQLVEADAVTA